MPLYRLSRKGHYIYKGVKKMYKVILELELKNDITLKDSYEKIANFIRTFIQLNNKGLKKEHYEKKFSYYTFSNFFPKEPKAVFKKNNIYQVEIRSLHQEIIDIRHFKSLETEDFTLVDANAGKLYYQGSGFLKSETPVYFKTKRIEDAAYEMQVVEQIKENIVFRYLKSGRNTNDDIAFIRTNVIKKIHINKKIITIPFKGKKLNNGQHLLYHCLHIDVQFHNNEIAKEVETVIYAGGLGLNTSNGFGLMKNEVM